MLMIAPQRIMSRIAWTVQVYKYIRPFEDEHVGKASVCIPPE
jgi:hypothetical protein